MGNRSYIKILLYPKFPDMVLVDMQRVGGCYILFEGNKGIWRACFTGS